MYLNVKISSNCLVNILYFVDVFYVELVLIVFEDFILNLKI